ncbi:hypothetical protein ACFPRL_02965 [Pseudoclavibacter helvolus]
MLAHDRGDRVEHAAERLERRMAVEGAPDVPVGSVQESHRGQPTNIHRHAGLPSPGGGVAERMCAWDKSSGRPRCDGRRCRTPSRWPGCSSSSR